MAQNWISLSDSELQTVTQAACAEHIQWLIDSYQLENGGVEVRGWAIGNPSDRNCFLLNGAPFDQVEYPLPSPDVGEFFWSIPSAAHCRFVCQSRVEQNAMFEDGFARVEFLANCGVEAATRSAWYLPNPEKDLDLPSAEQIRRVISVPDQMNYLLGGAAIYKRL